MTHYHDAMPVRMVISEEMGAKRFVRVCGRWHSAPYRGAARHGQRITSPA